MKNICLNHYYPFFSILNNISDTSYSYFFDKNIILGFDIQKEILIDLLVLLSIICAIYTILNKNPVISVLYLVGLYINVSCYIILIGLQFIGLSYILIYVGAISILFIFILMLINIRVSELLNNNVNSLILIIILTSVLNSILYSILPNKIIFGSMSKNSLNASKNNNIDVFNINNLRWDDSIIEYNTISSLGNTLYTDNLIIFLEASLILLLAMIGAILITVKPTNKK